MATLDPRQSMTFVSTGNWFTAAATIQAPSEPEAPERDERLIDHVTSIANRCHDQGVDVVSVVPELEGVVRGAYELREAAKEMNSRQRRVVADGLGQAIREVLS